MYFQPTTHPLLPEHEKHEKRAHLGAFFVSGTTPPSTTRNTRKTRPFGRVFCVQDHPTFHNTKHTKNTPVWVRSSCLGLPSPIPYPTSCRTRRTCPYGCVLRVRHLPHPAEHIRHARTGMSYMFICFSLHKHEKHAQAGVFLVVGTLPLPSNIKDAPFWRVFGGRHLPSLIPHPQPLKTSHLARFRGDNPPPPLSLLSFLSFLLTF